MYMGHESDHHCDLICTSWHIALITACNCFLPDFSDCQWFYNCLWSNDGIEIWSSMDTTLHRTPHSSDKRKHRGDFRFAPSQWETVLLCNDVSYWLCANPESALKHRYNLELRLMGISIVETIITRFNTEYFSCKLTIYSIESCHWISLFVWTVNSSRPSDACMRQ